MALIINFNDDTYLKQSFQVMKYSMLKIPMEEKLLFESKCWLEVSWSFLPHVLQRPANRFAGVAEGFSNPVTSRRRLAMTRSAAPVAAFPGASIMGRFARALVSLAKAVQDRREVRNLAEFDERMLKDVGLTRGDVIGALAEPMHHHPSWVLVRCIERPAPAAGPAAARKPRPMVPLVSRA